MANDRVTSRDGYMLDLPRPGYETSQRWFALGVMVAGGGVAWWVWSMTGSEQGLARGNAPIWTILALTAVVALSGFYRTWRDIVKMRKEEVDIEWLLETNGYDIR